MGMGVRFPEKGIEWRFPDFLYADDLVLWGKSEEDLKVMVRHFVEMCMRRGDGVILNILSVLWMNQVQMLLSVIGRWLVGGKLQALLGPWLMLGVCSLSSSLLFCMGVI